MLSTATRCRVTALTVVNVPPIRILPLCSSMASFTSPLMTGATKPVSMLLSPFSRMMRFTVPLAAVVKLPKISRPPACGDTPKTCPLVNPISGTLSTGAAVSVRSFWMPTRENAPMLSKPPVRTSLSSGWT